MEVLREGEDVVLLGTGTGVRVALAAADLLVDAGVTATVANVRRVRPLDVDALLALLGSHSAAVTVEENALAGGFGSSILEVLSDAGMTIPVTRVGLPDEFVAHGDQASLYRDVGFTGAASRREGSATGGGRPDRVGRAGGQDPPGCVWTSCWSSESSRPRAVWPGR